MIEGNKVIYKKEILERLNRNGKNSQANIEMEVVEVQKDVVVVRSGACTIRVNPNSIELVKIFG